MSVGLKVTLRKSKMYEFIDRLINIALPRVRDFRGISDKMLAQKVKEKFSSVRFVKPKASRDESVETYMLATGFKK